MRNEDFVARLGREVGRVTTAGGRNETSRAPLAARGSDFMNPPEILHALMTVIEARKLNPPPNSYTARLFAGGVDKISQKVMEEAEEVCEAADEPGEEGRAHLTRETADLVYHLLVMLAQCDVKLEAVEAELGRRFGISGLDEKASRPVETPS